MLYRNDLGAIYIKGLILLIKLWPCAVQLSIGATWWDFWKHLGSDVKTRDKKLKLKPYRSILEIKIKWKTGSWFSKV